MVVFSQSKVYLNIVKDIRKMIAVDGLQEGDKIPSERELTERLQVGRSSVREALRALELLGLIETRRGEGTFLKDFRNHELIRILGMFILDDDHVRKDLIETKDLIEKDLIRNICSSADKAILMELRGQALQQSGLEFENVIMHANNRLLYRIWGVLNSYSAELNNPDRIINHTFIDALINGDSAAAIAMYNRNFEQT